MITKEYNLNLAYTGLKNDHVKITIKSLTTVEEVHLLEIAHGRSGDKGNLTNVGIIARTDEIYPFLKKHLTAERVKEHMKNIVQGKVERYEMDNINALNFVLHDSLDGGGTVSLKLDAQGKTHAQALLRMKMEVPEELLKSLPE